MSENKFMAWVGAWHLVVGKLGRAWVGAWHLVVGKLGHAYQA